MDSHLRGHFGVHLSRGALSLNENCSLAIGSHISCIYNLTIVELLIFRQSATLFLLNYINPTLSNQCPELPIIFPVKLFCAINLIEDFATDLTA